MIAFGSANAQNCGADFWYSSNGLTVDFNDSSWSNSAGITSWTWDFDDNSTNSNLTNPTHTYATGGTYIVCLTINDSLRCSSTYCDTIVVTAPISTICSASFTHTIDSIDPAIVYFNNTSTPLAGAIFDWNFGDATVGNPASTSTAQDPTHTYSQSGTYSVTLTMIDSIGDTCQYIDSVVISLANSAPCQASYDIALDSSAAFNVILFNTSTNASSHVYHWDFGDGTTGSGRTPIHTYVSFGSYEVCLTITDTVLRCDTTVYCDTVGMDSLGNLKAGFGIEVREPVVVSLEEQKDNIASLNLYPNPANNKINLDLRAINEPLNIRIMDLSGRIILDRKNNSSGNIESFDISQYSRGIYFMLLDNGSTQEVKKFIVTN